MIAALVAIGCVVLASVLGGAGYVIVSLSSIRTDLATLAAAGTPAKERVDRLDVRIGELGGRLDGRIGEVSARLDQRVDDLDRQINERLDAVDGRNSERIAAVDERVRSLAATAAVLSDRTNAHRDELRGVVHELARVRNRVGERPA